MANNTIKDKFLFAIEAYAMLPAGSQVLCAVSGGADSVALLRLLALFREQLGIAELTACHINHCLRGDESDRDEQYVRELCLAWDIPLQVFREDAAAFARARGLSVEEGARLLRYGLFERACGGEGLIATAHTLSDSIETVIFNLARGTGLDGLTGIPPVRGSIIRPLIWCTRAEVEAFCREEGIAYMTDSTNLSDDYTRNHIRHHITPQLASINPGYEDAIARALVLLREDAAILSTLADDVLARARAGEGFACAPLVAAGRLLPRVILAMAREAGLSLDFARVQLCCRCVTDGSGAVQLGEGHTFYVHGGLAYIAAGAEKSRLKPVIITFADLEAGPVEVPLGRTKLTLALCNYEQIATNENFSQKDLKNVLDYAKMDSILVLRPYSAGDVLRQPGRGLTKQVKKLVSEARIPLHLRSDVWVIESGGRLCWACGFGQDESVVPDVRTTRCLLITEVPV